MKQLNQKLEIAKAGYPHASAVVSILAEFDIDALVDHCRTEPEDAAVALLQLLASAKRVGVAHTMNFIDSVKISDDGASGS